MAEAGVDSGMQERPGDQLEKYIVRGLDAIRQNNFGQAKEIFSDKEAAKSFGLDFERGMLVSVKKPPKDYDSARRTIDTVAQLSMTHMPRIDGQRIRMEIADIWSYDRDHLKPVTLSPEMQRLFDNNIALIHAEEWIHALRYQQGIRLDATDNTSTNRDEAEVAAYMMRHGILLTREFLDKYDRRTNLIKFGLV